MTFALTTSGYFYTKDQADALSELGFKFTPYPEHYKGRDMMRKDGPDEVTIEIKTLEELMAFTQKWGECVVGNGHIEIYDDYRE